MMKLALPKGISRVYFVTGAMMLAFAFFSCVSAYAQISLPYSEDFSSISAANGLPTVSGGSWAKTGTNALQPTYIANQSTYNRMGRTDTKFISFRYGQGTGGNVYTVGPFSLSTGVTYQVGVYYITDGGTGFGPLALTYGTGTTVASQSNIITSLPASITNTTYSQLQGTFTVSTAGSYYIGISCQATSAPWYLSLDDFSVTALVNCTGTPAAGTALAYSTIPVTGFTADIIANGVGAPTTSATADVDGVGYYLLDGSYQYTSSSGTPTYSLPTTGIINSAATSGLSFKLQSASANNSLRLAATNASGTLTLTNPVPATNLYLLATSGTGAATIDVAVNFTNSTTQTITGITVPDWYGGTPVAATAIGRVTATNTQDGTSTNPRLYQLTVPISASNSALNIGSLTITRTSTAGYVQIMAVSATTTSPAVICAGNTFTLIGSNPAATAAGLTYQWQESSTSSGPYTNVSTGTGGTTLTYTTAALAATKYYVLKITCTASSTSTLSNQVTATVNPPPTLSVATLPANSTICGTGSVTLTASGTGTSYLWSPANGLSATNVASPVATPTGTTTYTVLATGSSGCTSSASKTVSVFTTSTITATSSANNFCAGGATTLSAVDTAFGNSTAPTGYTAGTVTYPTTDEDFGTISFGPLVDSTICGSLAGNIGTATGTSGSYSDFTAFAPVSFYAGNSYPFTLKSITCGSSNYSNSMAMYIDYNQNGVFTDAGEAVYVATATTSGPHSESGTVFIPASAKPGVTRVRVIVNEGLVSGPQMSPGYGEIEDYSIRIIKTPNISATTGYTWSPSSFLNTVTGSTVTAAAMTASTTYTVTGIDSNGCPATGTVAVNVLPLPTISVSPATTAICIGGSVTLTASGSGSATYSWSPSTGLNTTTGASVIANPTATTTYTITATGTNGCVNTSTKTVTVNALPTIAVSPSTATAICVGSSVSLTAGGASTYSWSPATGLSVSTGTTVSASPTVTTSYIVTGTDANGCINSASKTVTVNPLPTVSFTPATATAICTGSSVSLTANGAFTYSWSPATGLSATTGATVSANPTATTTYTVTGTDGNGCVNTATKAVTVNPLPTVAISPGTVTAICTGSSVALTASGAVTYSWSPATGLSASTGGTVTANPTATTSYTVTGTDVNGCVNAATKMVTVNPLPTVAISPAATTTLCAGASVALTASGGITYNWSPAAGLSAATGATVTATPAATTTYTLAGTDANGCVNTATQLITVNPLPVLSVSPAGTPTICGSGSIVLTASGATSYSWAPSASLSASTGTSVTASPTTPTTYTITGTDANGCVNTINKTVNVNPPPTVSISPASATICSGNSVALTGSGALSYSWSPSGSLSSGTGTSVSASPTVTTTYTVTGTDANGCSSTTTRTINVNTSPTVTISPASATAFCIGGSVSLTAGGASSYVWAPITGLSAGSGATVTATPTSTITYAVTGTAANGCTGTTTRLITVFQLPTVTVSPAGTSAICKGSSLGLTASGATIYNWSPSASLSSSSGPNVTATPAVATTYTITGTDINGCINTTTKVITVNNLPSVSISPSASIAVCLGSGAGLSAAGATTYSWSPAAGLNTATGTTVIASPAVTTTYTVTGTDGNGCSNTDLKTVTVNPLPSVSISPSTAVSVCSGGGATLTANGALTYTWTPATGLSATTGSTVVATPPFTTTYTVTGTDGNGCKNTANRQVSVLGLPNVTISAGGSTTICPGTSVSLTGNGAATYSWTPVSSLSSGTGTTVIASPPATTTYTVTGTANNGCTSTATRTVTVLPRPIPDISPAGYINICQNDSVTLEAAAGFASYKWMIYGTAIAPALTNTLTTATGGFYTLTVIDLNGCSTTTSQPTVITVIQRPLPVITRTGAALDAGPGYLTYAWYRNGVAVAGANGQVFTPVQGGLYTVGVAADSNLCMGMSATYQYTALGVNNTAIASQIHLYPNPAFEKVRIDAPVAVDATVTSMDGKLIFSGKDVRELMVSEWADGIYQVVLRDKNGGYLKTEKLTKLSH